MNWEDMPAYLKIGLVALTGCLVALLVIIVRLTVIALGGVL